MLPDVPRITRTRRLALLVLLAVFGAGIATGAGASMAWRSHAWRRTSSRGFGTDWTQRLYAKSLDLTDEQKEKLRPAFERHSKAFHAINRKSLPDHHALNHDLDVEILPVLTPDQVAKFQKMQEGREKFLRGWAGEPGAEPASP